MAQIVQPLRFAPLCQISRAGAEHCPHFAHLAHVQRTIGQFGNADGHIDPFLDQPHDAIKQQQANIEIGVGADQPGDDGQDMKPPEKNRGGDGQDSTGRRSQTARVLEGPVNFGQAQTATVQKALALASEAHTAGRARKQGDAKIRLERGDRARHRGWGLVQAPRGLCKTGLFGNRNERAQGAKLVHGVRLSSSGATMKCMLGRLSSHLY